MPVGSGSSFMVRAPRGRLSWMENIRRSFWELSLHQKQDRRWRIILPVPVAQRSQRTTWIKVEKRGVMRRGGGGRGGGSAGSWSREEPRIPLGFLGLGLDLSRGSELKKDGEESREPGKHLRGVSGEPGSRGAEAHGAELGSERGEQPRVEWTKKWDKKTSQRFKKGLKWND